MPVTTYTIVDGELLSENRNGTERQYVPDAQGNTIALLNTSGAIVKSYAYWSYGSVESGDTTATKYLHGGTYGIRRQANGDNYARLRIVDPVDGRWLTVDPLWPGEEAYLFCYASPVLFVDYDGANPFTPCEQAGLMWISARGQKAAGSRSEVFRRCQSGLEAQQQARIEKGWSLACPGGPMQICEACAKLSGLPFNCGSYPSCVPANNSGGSIGGLDYSVIGSLINLFGSGIGFDSDACIRTCMVAPQRVRGEMNKKKTRHACKAACLALRSGGAHVCDLIFNRCKVMGDYYERVTCIGFWEYLGCPTKGS